MLPGHYFVAVFAGKTSVDIHLADIIYVILMSCRLQPFTKSLNHLFCISLWSGTSVKNQYFHNHGTSEILSL